MSFETVMAGLNERYATVSGIKVRLDYEPSSVQNSPLIYSILDTMSREYPGTVVQVTYRIRSRLCIRWQNPEQAEATLIALVNAIPVAIDQDRRLGGVVRNARVQTGDAGWVTIGQIDYRTVDFWVEVLEIGQVGTI